jgi:hypothetical protein
MATFMAFVLALPALMLMVQQPATVQGTVMDPAGVVVAAATVTLAGADIQQIVQTGDDGQYRFTDLAAGAYTLKVEFAGFEAFEQRVAVEPGRTLRLAVALRIAGIFAEVTVTADHGRELSTDPDRSARSLVVKGADLEALPDNPDDLMDMLQALAGPGRVQILVDGLSGSEIPPKGSIKEVRMNQDRFSADRDSWWAGIEIVTKPGADAFRGNIGLTDSNASFNSRNPYAANKADYLNRLFTANAGDSVNNRAFWTISLYQNTINNTALINAVTLDPGTLTELPVRSSVVIPRDDISGTGRFDYRFATNHTLTGGYRSLRSHRDDNGVGQYNLESRGYPSRNSTQQAHLTETAIFGKSVVTDTRFGYTRTRSDQFDDGSTPSLLVASAFNGGSSQLGQTTHVNTLVELQSNTTVIRQSHTIRFGGRMRHNAIEDVAPTNFGGTFLFFGVTDAPVLDGDNQPIGNRTAQISSLEQYRRTLLFERLRYPAGLIRSLGGGASQFSIATGNPLIQFGVTDLGLYGGDDWRVRPNLTISVGLRYEMETDIHDWHDVGPRAGLAWSPGAPNGTPKTVFRLGAGLFYNRFDSRLIQQALRFDGLTEQQYIVPNPDFFPVVPATGSLLGGQSSTSYRLGPNVRSMPQWMTSATVERQLAGKTSLSIMYLDQHTTHIPKAVNVNTPLAKTDVNGQPGGIRPYGDAAGNLFQYQSVGIQEMKWLEIHVSSKVRRNMSLSAQYFLIDAHNDGGWDNLTPSNPYDFNADWSQASWTGRHRINLIGTMMAPWGIQLSSLVVTESGHPYDLTIGSDLNGDTVVNDRPAFATDRSRPSVVLTRFGAFDTDPLPGQTIVPRNYLIGSAMWTINMRLSKTFGFGATSATPAGRNAGAAHRAALNVNIEVNNLLNHVNQGGYVGALSSPLFGQSTALRLFSDTSNNRKVQFGAQVTF